MNTHVTERGVAVLIMILEMDDNAHAKQMDYLSAVLAQMDGASKPKPAELLEHKFWSTQPVPQLSEELISKGEINPLPTGDNLRLIPFALPDGYEWYDLDIAQSEEDV